MVSHTFSIEKGKTVEDMLNLAVEQGYINSYSHGTPYPGYTAYYVNSIAVNGIAYTQPANYSEYWSSTINGAWESDGINGNKIESDGFSYELSYVSNDPNTKYDNGTGTYPTSPNAPHPDKATPARQPPRPLLPAMQHLPGRRTTATTITQKSSLWAAPSTSPHRS